MKRYFFRAHNSNENNFFVVILEWMKSTIESLLSFKSWRFIFLEFWSSAKSRPLIPISLLILIILIPIFILTSKYLNPKSEAAWFDESFQYRKVVPITNSGVATSNQYIKITLDTAALISAGKLQNNCNDIRTTNVNGKLLDHFIDGDASYACNTSTTSIYVIVDNVSTSGSNLLLYYGNPSAGNVEPRLGTQQNPGISCRNILKHRSDSQGNGQYYIAPTGNLSSTIQVYCDMTYSSGGWIQVWHGLPTEARANVSTNETVNLSNNIIFNEMRVEGSNLNFNVVDTVTQTAMLGNSIRTYYNQVSVASDTPNPRVAFHNLSGTQSIYLTNNYFLFGYGNVWRVFYTCVNTSSLESTYLGGHSPTCTPRNTFNPTSVGCVSSNYCSTSRDNVVKDSGLNLTLYQYQETSVYVRETALTLNINQSMGSLGTEEKSIGPVAYWKFDEGVGSTAYDSGQNKIDGYLGIGNSAPSWVDESGCISGKCLNFDGVNDYLNYSNTSLPNVGVSGSLTISVWVKPIAASGTIFTKGQSGNCFNYGINLTGAVLRSRNSNGDYLLGGSIIPNTWQQLVIVYSGSGAEGYINGKSIGSNASGGTSNCANNQWVMGARAYNALSSEKFNGFIDDVKIYPYSRTAVQIAADYNAGLARQSSSKGTSASLGSPGASNLSNGLVGYWKMDEATAGTGSTAYDASGNNNNGIGTGTSVIAGKFGNGKSFGVSDYVNVPYNSILDQINTVTLVAWVKFTTNANTVVVEKSTNNTHYQFQVFSSAQGTGLGGELVFMLQPDPTNWVIAKQQSNDGQWHQVVGTYDRSIKTASIYIDGVLKNTNNNIATGPTSNASPLLMGSRTGAGGFGGSLDEVRVYNRPLSPKEVADLYNFSPGPIGYWNFDEKNAR